MRARHALLIVLVLLVSVSFTACSLCPFATSHPETRYDVATDLKDDGNYAKAIASYSAFIKENKHPALNAYAQYNIGVCYAEMGKKAQALAAFKQVSAKYPKSDTAVWAKADIARLQKKTAIPATKATPKKVPAKIIKKIPAKTKK